MAGFTEQLQRILYMAAKRKYPVGIQSFESIRLDGYIYVDKTPLIYKMGISFSSKERNITDWKAVAL
jgi:hypothetical protein